MNNNTLHVTYLNATMVCSDRGLDSGKNLVVLCTVSATGAAMTFDTELWAGTNSILVNLESSPGVAYTGRANVTVRLSDNESVKMT